MPIFLIYQSCSISVPMLLIVIRMFEYRITDNSSIINFHKLSLIVPSIRNKVQTGLLPFKYIDTEYPLFMKIREFPINLFNLKVKNANRPILTSNKSPLLIYLGYRYRGNLVL